MSVDIGFLKNTGSRGVDLQVTSYFGGLKKGVCVQLSAEMEEGSKGYIQLSADDIVTLIPILKKYVVEMNQECGFKEFSYSKELP